MNINWRCLGFAILGAIGFMSSLAFWFYILLNMPGPLMMAAWGVGPLTGVCIYAFYNHCVSRTRSSRP